MAFIQLIAFIVHLNGLINNGKGFITDCFIVDFGDVYYTIFANLGGFIQLFLQFYYVTQIRCPQCFCCCSNIPGKQEEEEMMKQSHNGYHIHDFKQESEII